MKIDSVSFYNKAKESFIKCIKNPDNQFLKEEIEIPLDVIRVFEKNINVVLSEKTFNNPIFEISLSLFDEFKEIGIYVYIENDKGVCIDDSLIFY